MIKIKSNKEKARNLFLLLVISMGEPFLIFIISFVFEIITNIQNNTPLDVMFIIIGFMFPVFLAEFILMWLFMVFFVALRKKKMAKLNGVPIQATIMKILKPSYRTTTFEIVGFSGLKSRVFKIEACDYDENGNCRRTFKSDWLHGAYANEVIGIFTAQNVRTLTVYVDPKNPGNYSFDIDEIQTLLNNPSPTGN